MRRTNKLASISILTFCITLSFAAQISAQDQPTIAKDSVQVTAWTNGEYKGSYDTWSWVPRMEFRINGPIDSGGKLYVEVSQPGTAAWVKFDCRTEETQKGRWWKPECGGRDIPIAKSSTYVGPVTFAIKMRNELAGSDITIFSGKAKVSKVHSNLSGPTAVNKWVYYVDQDWNLPIGYVYLTPDDVDEWKKPMFNVSFWVRGEATGFEPHLFFQGKEVGKVIYDGEQVGRPSCDSEFELNTTHFVNDSVPQKAKWSRVNCHFSTIRGWDKTGEAPGMFGPMYSMNANPGEYEFKLLWNGHLARSIKFNVDREGK